MRQARRAAGERVRRCRPRPSRLVVGEDAERDEVRPSAVPHAGSRRRMFRLRKTATSPASAWTTRFIAGGTGLPRLSWPHPTRPNLRRAATPVELPDEAVRAAPSSRRSTANPRLGYGAAPLIGGGGADVRGLKECLPQIEAPQLQAEGLASYPPGGQIHVWTLAHGHWFARAHARRRRRGWHRLPRPRDCLAALVSDDHGPDSRP